MPSDDPWSELSAPNIANAISARRVDSRLPWGFFWARSLDNHCLLVLRHKLESSPNTRLPKLKGVEMMVTEADENDARMLVLRLADTAHRDVFYQLCADIVASAGTAPTEPEAVKSMLARTWRWHHLLRGGVDERLRLEEQKGLIGELIVLETLIVPYVAASDAVSSWHGPLGSPKDFELGGVCIEAKARRGAATPYVVVSSEFQLDTSGIEALFLHVAELYQEQAMSTAEVKQSLTLTDFAARCKLAISSRDEGAIEPFDALLAAAGFRWEDDYRDTRWTQGRHHIFRVGESFPTITAASCPPGVSNVTYSLALADCEPYRVAEDELLTAIAGHSNAD
jgi:hypothetical protein